MVVLLLAVLIPGFGAMAWSQSVQTDNILLPVAKIDEQQFQEVIMNLLNNAKDAMPGGGTLEIRTGLDQDMVKIDISDSGCGIPEDVREKIFEPFFSTNEKVTGLGLAICYSIIRAHNGEIKLKSQEGKGTTFSILLPGG